MRGARAAAAGPRMTGREPGEQAPPAGAAKGHPEGAGPAEARGSGKHFRVRCISDVHVDEAENRRWIENLPEHPEDVLLVAGDLTDNLALAREALRALRGKYREVFCVPGNHDLWISRKEESGITDSLKKLHAFLAMCADEDVCTQPRQVGADEDGAGGIWIVPLLSWHHQSFDTEPDITCWEGIPTADQCMSDYRRCKWPSPLRQDDDSVARQLDEMNDRAAPLPESAGSERSPIISFSHFVPRVDLNPEKRFLFMPCLNKAVGSRFLGERVERLGSAMHVFGHTHFGWDATHDGTRYVQAALGYPNEWRERRGSMEIGSLPDEPVTLWDSVDGFVPPMVARWSQYYERNPRRPELTHMLAPYVAPMYRALPGGEVCDWPMGPPPSRR